MFVLNTDRVVWWPVKVRVPQDGGKFEEQEFTGQFKLLTRNAVNAATEKGGFDELIRSTLIGWGDAKVEGGGELVFSTEARESMIGVPYVRQALVVAYTEAASGGARIKN